LSQSCLAKALDLKPTSPKEGLSGLFKPTRDWNLEKGADYSTGDQVNDLEPLCTIVKTFFHDYTAISKGIEGRKSFKAS